MKDEREPFPAFLETLTVVELAKLQHEARAFDDRVTLRATLEEFRRRERAFDQGRIALDCRT